MSGRQRWWGHRGWHGPSRERCPRLFRASAVVALAIIALAPEAARAGAPGTDGVTGRVHRAGSATGVPGARVFLLYDDSRLGEPPLPCDEDQSPVDLVTDPAIGASDQRPLPRPVGEACLPEGQQGQTTPSGAVAGLYRFDVPPSDPAMAYRLHVRPPAPWLAFPSVTRPARSGFAPPGPAVDGTVPDPAGADDHWLRFRIATADDSVTNNHVPLDVLDDLVAIRKDAGRSIAGVGDLVPYAVTVTNRSGEDIRVVAGGAGGGLSIRDLVPDGMRYVRGTTVASRVVVGPDGIPQRVCPRLGGSVDCPSRRQGPTALAGDAGRPAVGGLLDFGPYDLPAGQSLEVHYTLAVAADATVGEKMNRASVLLDNRFLAEARAAVRIVPDPLFDQGTLYGKVYCDEGEGGQQDPGDRGLPGVRIFADIGHFSVSDSAGKWHLQRIPPGMRLLKVDERTLPPGSRLLDPAARTIYVTPGLDTTVSWRVRCDLEPVAPASVTLRVPEAPPEVRLEGSAVGLGLTIDRDPATVVRADVRLADGEVSADLREAAGSPPDLRPDDPLRFHTRVSGPIAWWRLVVARVPTAPGAEKEPRAWERVFAADGTGRPPDALEPPGGAAELAPEALYAYWLLVAGPDGVAARSPVRTFGVALTAPAAEEAELLSIDDREGATFENEAPTARLQAGLAPVVERLRAEPRARLRIVVHVDASRGEAALSASEARAAAVRDWLVGEGIDPARIEVEGVGSTDPVVPNIGLRNQAMNRRVEATIVPAPTGEGAVPTLTFEPRALVAGVGTVVPGEDGGFRLDLPVPDDGRLVVGLRRADGATVGVARRLDARGQSVDFQSLSDSERGLLLAFAREAAEGLVTETRRPEVQTLIAPPETVEAVDDEALLAEAMADAAARQAVRVHLSPGPAAPGQVRVAGHEIALPLLQVAVYADPAVLRPDEDGRWSGLVAFDVEVPDIPLSVWRLEVGREGESPRIVARGDGAPPPRIEWSGPEDVLAEGDRFAYRLVVRDEADNVGRSAPGEIVASAPPEVTVLHDVFDGDAVTEAARADLAAIAERVAGLGLGARVRVEVHTDPEGGEAAAIARTESRARAVGEVLAEAGVHRGAVTTVGRGAREPMVPNLNPRNRARNNRVVVSVTTPPPSPLPAADRTARVEVAGQDARKDDQGVWVTWLESVPDRLWVEVVTVDGREIRYRIRIPAPTAADAGAGGGFGSARAAWPGRLVAQGTVLGEDEDGETPPDPVRDEETTTGLGAGTVLGDDEPLGPELADPEAMASERDEVAPEDEEAPAETATHEATPPAAPATTTLTAPIQDVDLSAVPAARTVVWWPPTGAVARSTTFGFVGETAPGNRVAVNGRDVPVGRDGRFHAVVDLPAGPSTVVVQVVDPAGNEVSLSREIVSEPDGIFVLAMADTHAGPTGAELAGVGVRTRVGLGPVYLHGRAVGYAKGQWQLDEGPFRDLSVTLHVDSAKERETSYFADLVAPDRHYPIYGDAADEVQDVAAAGPVYLSARADANELRIGNFQTDPGVGGLFRYRRTFYGARLTLDQSFLDGDVRSQGEVFVADDPVGVRPGHVVLQGTGGSLYFLRHRDLMEGSERVRVVVRDRETGAELASRPLTRNVDYVLRHREGQVLLMAPLPSVVEAGWMAGMNLSSTFDGHPVFLVVDYEHLSAPGEGAVAGGGYLTETFFDWLKVGGGILSQGAGPRGTPYRIWGLMAEARPRPSTFVRAEFARSSGSDVDGHYSADGGLSFVPLVPECVGPAERSPICRDGGSAFRIDAAASLGDVLGLDEDVVRAMGHLHLQEYGFYGSQLLLDHGQRRIGGRVAWDVTEIDVLSARLDRVASDVPIGVLGAGTGPTREVVRHYGGLRYQRREARWRAAGEWAFGRVRDEARDPGEDVLDTHVLSAGGEYDATERLALVLEQDLVLAGDPRIFDAWNDRFTTTLGGRWLLTESLRLSLLGQVRWNGEHSALVGLQAKTGGQGNVYARQRITRLAGGSGWRAQSVIGGEQTTPGGLRSYGEYQLDGGMSGQHGRAVLGLSHRWRPVEGVTASAAYERVQVLGDPGLGPGVPGATLDPLTGRESTGGRVDGQPPFDAVGTNPAGAFYPGAVSRDAVSAGLELLFDEVKASARVELRHDAADERLAGTVPGVADRVQTVATANAAWTWTRDLSTLGRLNWAGTVNRTRREAGLEAQEALWLEATAGVVYRPEHHDWVNVLLEYTRLVDQRPLELTLGTGDRHASHVVSLAPVVRTPWRATITEKVAYKRTGISVGLGLPDALRPPDATAHTVLWINRIDFHVLPRWDLTGEYRVLWVGAEDAEGDGITATRRSGFVVEAAFRAADHLRLGVGWNFARFGDDALSRLDRDEGGPFLRVTGTY